MKTNGKFRIKYFGIVILSLVILVNIGIILRVLADPVDFSVTVGNNAPVLSGNIAENPESSTTSPTNVGSSVTWEATASDSGNENYYLIICSTNSVSATNGGAPTCGGTQYCISGSTASGNQSTCNRTALIGDSESNAWFGFVCDANASAAACSTSNQGSGATGSPFIVNHAPAFTAISNDGPKNPGQTITWSSTASDSDSSGGADTVLILVCKTTGVSGNTCDGGVSDTWCSSSLSASNPTCNYSIPAVTPDTSYNAYVYVLDNSNFGSASGNQGSNTSYVVNNVAPVVSSVSINGGNAIDLTEGSTTNVIIGATVTDNNSCAGGEISTVYGYAYRSGTAYVGCDTAGEANNNNCYSEVSCSVTGGTCSGTSDASADYTCTVSITSYADPTDIATLYTAETWKSSFKVIDNNASSHNAEVASGVEMNSLTALDVTGTVNYGTLDVGQSNDPLDKITTVTPTGNVGLDEELSGSQMCTNYPTCNAGTIAVGYQKYALASLTAYSSGNTLTGSPVEAELNLAKTLTNSPTTKNTWWGILIPPATPPGLYSGVNVVGAVKGETANW